MQLPIGVYVVAEAFREQTGIVEFDFKETTYQATVGVNAFGTLEEFVAAPIRSAESFCGYENTPILILPKGVYLNGKSPIKAERLRTWLPALTILGENAGVSPNGSDLRTPVWAESSVLEGSSVYYGSLGIRDPMEGVLTIDGVTLRNCRITDTRRGVKKAGLILKNCAFEGYAIYSLVQVYPATEPEAERFTQLQDIRIDGIDARASEGRVLDVSCGDLEIRRLYLANTDKFLGLSDYSCQEETMLRSIKLGECLFENCQSIHGLTLMLPENARTQIRIDKCQFLNVTPENDPVIRVRLPKGSSLELTDTCFAGNHKAPAILVEGDLDRVKLTDARQEGYRSLCEQKISRRTMPDKTFSYELTDPHSKAEPDGKLEQLYAGRKVYFGDFHCHSNSGGTSDGKTPIENYIPDMHKLQMDFAAIVDHGQMRHFFLPCWDEKYLICGTEPGTKLQVTDRPDKARSLHYTWIFPDKTGLAKLLEDHPQFRYTGGTDGFFKPVPQTVEEVAQLSRYVYSIGGLMTHAHPRQMIDSPDPLHYFFDETMALETVHADVDAYSTMQNRELWIRLLKLGKRLRTHGSTDSHGPVSNRGLTAVYSPRHHSSDIFSKIRAGDCVAGGVGIRMCIGDVPMGGVAEYAPGALLQVAVGKFHPAHRKPETVYSLKIYTDQGLAYAEEFDPDETPQVALPVKKRSYYRCEIWNESDDRPVALSNPIWLNV